MKYGFFFSQLWTRPRPAFTDHFQFAVQLKSEAGLQGVTGLLPWVCTPVCQRLIQLRVVFRFTRRPVMPVIRFLVPVMLLCYTCPLVEVCVSEKSSKLHL